MFIVNSACRLNFSYDCAIMHYYATSSFNNPLPPSFNMSPSPFPPHSPTP